MAIGLVHLSARTSAGRPSSAGEGSPWRPGQGGGLGKKPPTEAASGGTKWLPRMFPGRKSGALALELSEEFRNNARHCLELSGKAESLQAQGYWVAMAQLWFDLALHAEDRQAIEGVDLSAIGAAFKDRRKPK